MAAEPVKTELPAGRSVHLCLIAGEHSGDALGGPLMAALRGRSDLAWTFSGVGGELMEAQGLTSRFPLSEIAIMGPLAILSRLPKLLRRVREAADTVIAARPAGLVIIDSPEFTHAVARRVRRRLPDLPIIDYVSPSVWAWRQGRARRMRAYVDHVLAILPFEPAAHERLGGPPCSYVGHPLVERLDEFAPDEAARAGRPPKLLVLPGSRVTEVRRLMRPFGETLRLLQESVGAFEAIVPAPDNVRSLVEELAAGWPIMPRIVSGQAAKMRAFREARAALAASGTVSLELALARVPMVIGYRIDLLAAAMRFLLKAHSVVLPNLIIGRNAVPEFIQERCTPQHLANALAPLLAEGPARAAQLQAFDEVVERMTENVESPSERAAAIVLQTIGL